MQIDPTPNTRPHLTADGLGITRQDGQRPQFTLQNVALRLEAGELVLLQGRSGCGKSSLLMALAGLIPLQSGSLNLGSMAVETCAPPLWRIRVSLVPAVPVTVSGTVAENLLLPWTFSALRGRTAPTEVELLAGMADLGLAGVGLAADAAGLSSGQTARVTLLRHLLLRPDYLLLDEPTAHLDPESAGEVWRLLKRQRQETGCGILCAAHHLEGITPDRSLRLGKDGLESRVSWT